LPTSEEADQKALLRTQFAEWLPRRLATKIRAGHAFKSAAGARRTRKAENSSRFGLPRVAHVGGKSDLGIDFRDVGKLAELLARVLVKSRDSFFGTDSVDGGRPGPRKFRCDVTNTASKRPERVRRCEARVCSPTPSESMATREATPTATPAWLASCGEQLRVDCARPVSLRSRVFNGALHH